MKQVRTREKIRKATENPNKESLESQIPSLAQLGRACHVYSDPSRSLDFDSLGRPLTCWSQAIFESKTETECTKLNGPRC